jgi:hypothetical protein
VLQSPPATGLLRIAMGAHDAPDHATSRFMPIACFPALWRSIYCCILWGVAENPKGTPVALCYQSATGCYGCP